jgi:hypothetical protein
MNGRRAAGHGATGDCPWRATVPACAETARTRAMTTCVFVQIRCDLLMKLYVPGTADVGHYINENLLDIDGIERSLTTLTFKAF